MAVGVAEPGHMSKVELDALRDQRRERVEDAARVRARAMLAAEKADQDLTQALKDAEALNKLRPRMVTDQQLADWVNEGTPTGAVAFRNPLEMSNMAIRRRTGKAKDTRRNRGRR